jgi:hypothetical protein
MANPTDVWLRLAAFSWNRTGKTPSTKYYVMRPTGNPRLRCRNGRQCDPERSYESARGNDRIIMPASGPREYRARR